jgi:transcription initiation factor TFIIIB Brf1 subunit/transcription initiation factor TFIIB
MKIAMEYCPNCERENYAMAVMSGECAWCGYVAKQSDVNKKWIWNHSYEESTKNRPRTTETHNARMEVKESEPKR